MSSEANINDEAIIFNLGGVDMLSVADIAILLAKIILQME